VYIFLAYNCKCIVLMPCTYYILIRLELSKTVSTDEADKDALRSKTCLPTGMIEERPCPTDSF
jgi:hypothetical protein